MFMLKKIIGSLLMPLPMAVLLVVCACAILYRARAIRSRRGEAAKSHNLFRIATGLLLTAGIIIVLASNSVIARLLIGPLENQYSSYAGQPVDAVLVLGRYHASSPQVPVTSYLEYDGMTRLTEGIRIALLNEEASLVVSGPHFGDVISQAEAYREVAVSLGFPPERIVLLESGRDTHEEILEMANLIGDKPFALVTSAYHMPRSMSLAKRQGLHAVAAPTWHKVKQGEDSGGANFWFLVPSVGAITITTWAWHEYLGLAWYQLTGRI